MPEFIVRVGTPDGEIVERRVMAGSIATAEDELRRQGLHVFEARRGALRLADMIPMRRRGISTQQFLLFNQELLALVRAGLPILQSFDIMLERQKNVRFREILTDVRDKLKSGVSLSDAFASYGDVFPPIYSTSLRAGERSGDLEGVLKRFLRYQKIIVNLRKRVVGALIYPVILISLSTAMVIIMLTVVIPKFAEFYSGFNAQLPWVTLTAISLAETLRSNILLIGLSLFVGYVAFRRWVASAGRILFDRFKLHIPLAGGVLHRFAIMQFTQSLGTLLSGGTPMVPAIEIASQSVTNQMISGKIFGIVQNSTGALTEMLTNVSEFYDEEIEARLTRIVAAIEPIILVVMGCVIAVLLYAFYLPLFQLSTAAGNG